jgi:hypothetical protein
MSGRLLRLAPLLLNYGFIGETASDGANKCRFRRDNAMDLMIWVPVTFLLGVGSVLVCYVFLIACENI